MIKYVRTEADFNVNDGIVLVDFYADWCGPCKMIAPQLEKIQTDYPALTILKVDVDALPILSNRYDVSNIPSLDIYENGMKKSRKIGFLPADRLLSEIEAVTTFMRKI
jgi:thioredoxin 1